MESGGERQLHTVTTKVTFEESDGLPPSDTRTTSEYAPAEPSTSRTVDSTPDVASIAKSGTLVDDGVVVSPLRVQT